MSPKTAQAAPTDEDSQEQVEGKAEEFKAEIQAQKEQSQAFKEEVPEAEQGTFVVSLLGGIGIGLVNKRLGIRDAFKTLNDPHFTDNLLKVRDPAKFQRLLRDFELAKNEVEKQRKSARTKDRGFTQVGVGRFKQTIDFAAFDHKVQALELAHGLQQKIGAETSQIKAERTASVFNLNQENQKKLGEGFEEWQKKILNRNKSYHDYLHAEGTRLHLEQRKAEGIGGLSGKDRKALHEELNKQLAGSRIEVIKRNSEQIIAAQSEVKRLHDPQSPLLEPEGLKSRVEQTLTNPQSIERIPPGKTPSLAPTMPSRPVRPSVFARMANAQNAIQQRIAQIQEQIFQKIFGQAMEAIKNAVNRMMAQIAQQFAKRIASTAAGRAASIAAKAALKFGAKFLAGSVVPVIGNAVALLSSLGDLKSLLQPVLEIGTKAAIFAVVSVVLVVFLVMAQSQKKPMQKFALPNEEPQVASVFEYEKKFSWGEFEKTFPTTKKKDVWLTFENNYLSPEF